MTRADEHSGKVLRNHFPSEIQAPSSIHHGRCEKTDGILHLLSLRYPTVAMVPECRTITHSSDRTNDARSRISSSTVQLWTAFLLSLVAEVEAIAADFKIEDRMDVEEDHFEEVALFQLVEVEVDLDLVDISHIRGSHDNNIHSNHRIVLKKSVLLHLIIIQV
jgi:hypothetical protein